MTVPAYPIVERLNVVGNIDVGEISVLVDPFLDSFFLQLLKKDSATALSQQFPRRLMLGSSRFVRQKRRQSSLQY
jgi:hypothetical protein